MNANGFEDGEYDEAIAKEISWLDQQLVQHVVDELAKRKLEGQILLSAQVERAIDDVVTRAVTQAVAQAVTRHGPAFAAPAQAVPLSSSPFEKSRIRFDQPVEEPSSAIVKAEPPIDHDGVDHDWTNADFPDDKMDNSDGPVGKRARTIISQPADRKKWPHFSPILASIALMAVVGIGFGVWQMLRANTTITRTAALESDIAKAQTELDDALCAANYPAVLAAIEAKAEAGTALSDADKTVEAYDRYRGAIPDQTGGPSRVDATPPCAAGPDSAP